MLATCDDEPPLGVYPAASKLAAIHDVAGRIPRRAHGALPQGDDSGVAQVERPAPSRSAGRPPRRAIPGERRRRNDRRQRSRQSDCRYDRFHDFPPKQQADGVTINNRHTSVTSCAIAVGSAPCPRRRGGAPSPRAFDGKREAPQPSPRRRGRRRGEGRARQNALAHARRDWLGAEIERLHSALRPIKTSPEVGQQATAWTVAVQGRPAPPVHDRCSRLRF